MRLRQSSFQIAKSALQQCVFSLLFVSAAYAESFIVGHSLEFPPYDFKSNNTERLGFEFDVIELIAKKANLDVEYRTYDTWADLLLALKTNEIDVIPSLGITDERSDYTLFTATIFTHPVTVFIRQNSHDIYTLEQLNDRPIGVVSGDISGDILAARQKNIIVPYHSIVEALLGLISGRVDGLVYPDPVIWKISRDAGLDHEIKKVGPTLVEVKRSIGVSKLKPELFAKLQPIVAETVQSQQYHLIYEKWFSEPPVFWTANRVFWVMLGLIFLLVLSAVWSRFKELSRLTLKLSTEIEQRQNAEYGLQLANEQLEEKVTERTNSLKESRDELLTSEARYHQIFENNLAVKMIIDPSSGNILEANNAAAQFYGYPIETLVKMNIADINTMSAAEIMPKMEHALLKETNAFTFKHRLASGKVRDVEVYSGPIVTAHETFLYSIIFDVTDRIEAKKKLQLAATVFSSTSEAIMVTDADSKIIDVNDAFEEITGYSRQDALGSTPKILKSGRQDEQFYKNLWASLKETGSWRGEIWNRRKDSRIYPELLTINEVKNSQGTVANYVAVFSDISSIKQSEERLDHLAHYDPLTGLPNRLLLNERLEQSIKYAKRANTKIAIVFIDLDRFKNINDSLGHNAGDELLKNISTRLTQALREEDTIARTSGDEFVVIIEEMDSIDSTELIVHKLMHVFDVPFVVSDKTFNLTASMGVSVYPEDGEDADELMRTADSAMYMAKTDGRNTFQFYGRGDISGNENRMTVELALQSALANNEFYLVYQPQFDLTHQRVIGLEALIRWQHPQLGLVSPAQFISIAEQIGKIRDIGKWVLMEACLQGKKWLDQGLSFGRLSVNVSGQQLHVENFTSVVKTALATSELPACYLELELTESFVMNRIDASVEQLTSIRNLGVKIAIDDFGTGYSSLEYLKKLPIDRLKIDQSFVRDIPHDTDDMAISIAVIVMGKALGMEVIAEGIETEAQIVFLKENGCDYGQGYLYSRPIMADQVVEFILANTQENKQ